MKILLINIDSKLPNIALYKIALYHQTRGDEVIRDFPLAKNIADKIYMSCIFSWNKDKCRDWEGIAEIGGSGYDITKTLPSEIEAMKPKINYGFTTRGCIRNCEFCIVPKKEGKIQIVGDIYDMWDGKSKWIELLDNNILALPNHFRLICNQLIKENLKVNFSQGLDIRLINDDNALLLSKVRHLKQVHFAWDTMNEEIEFRRGITTLTKYIKPSKIMVYVLCGFNTTHEEDMYRRNEIRALGCDPFVMVYNKSADKSTKEFARWNNRYAFFKNLPFDKYLELRY
jgi:hypothetical protein